MYDDELVAVLSDFFHADGTSLATPRPDAHHWLPVPLINGRGQFDCNSTHEEVRWCSPVERAEFLVTQGRKYRIRLIGAMSRVGFKFSISHHSLRVVSRQGLELEPFQTNEVALFPGDRYDVIVEASQPIAEYKIRVQITGCDACEPDGTNKQPNYGYISWAAFRYQGAIKMSASEFRLSQTDEQGNPLQSTTYSDHRIAPARGSAPPPSTRTWTLNLTSERFWVENDVAPHRRWFFNGREFSGMMTQTPLLYRVLRGEKFSATEDLLFTANDGEVIDIIFNAQHNQDHPMHLHGYKFWVLGTGKGNYNGDTQFLNLRDPPHIDTINVEGNSWLYLRFVADNPGVWIMHCHLDFHHKEEMAVGFIVAPEKLRSTATLAHVPMCDTYAQLTQKYGFSRDEEPEAGSESNGALGFTAIAFVIVGLFLIGATAGVLFWKQQLETRKRQQQDAEIQPVSDDKRTNDDVVLPTFDEM
eukprot:TRINITY_DN815_c0_g1_i3.p1 TRINITY_DN815_c0_g1~~TRINITY_DN815_c0_g1_i3.p1  ORF type:complete len:472 (+),score=41.03 TRINITY_DN815_c0_g1_i3:645-2060(+)